MDAKRMLQAYIAELGQKIEIDGAIGPNTLRALDSLNIPKYLKIALREVGVHEIHGVKHNKRVLEYHSLSGGFSTDEVPWCGSFINWVMLNTGYTTVTYPARAKSWLNFGKSSGKPTIGSIAVKSRTGGGHVCFVIGEDAVGNLYCLGGNQSDEVNIHLYPRNAFLDFRVPNNTGGEYLYPQHLHLALTSSSGKES